MPRCYPPSNSESTAGGHGRSSEWRHSFGESARGEVYASPSSSSESHAHLPQRAFGSPSSSSIPPYVHSASLRPNTPALPISTPFSVHPTRPTKVPQPSKYALGKEQHEAIACFAAAHTASWRTVWWPTRDRGQPAAQKQTACAASLVSQSVPSFTPLDRTFAKPVIVSISSHLAVPLVLGRGLEAPAAGPANAALVSLPERLPRGS